MRLFKFEYNPHLKWIILESALEKNVHYFYDSTILSDFFFIFIMSKLESPKNIAYKIWIHLDLDYDYVNHMWIQITRFENFFMIKLVPLKSGPT